MIENVQYKIMEIDKSILGGKDLAQGCVRLAKAMGMRPRLRDEPVIIRLEKKGQKIAVNISNATVEPDKEGWILGYMQALKHVTKVPFPTGYDVVFCKRGSTNLEFSSGKDLATVLNAIASNQEEKIDTTVLGM